MRAGAEGPDPTDRLSVPSLVCKADKATDPGHGAVVGVKLLVPATRVYQLLLSYHRLLWRLLGLRTMKLESKGCGGFMISSVDRLSGFTCLRSLGLPSGSRPRYVTGGHVRTPCWRLPTASIQTKCRRGRRGVRGKKMLGGKQKPTHAQPHSPGGSYSHPEGGLGATQP